MKQQFQKLIAFLVVFLHRCIVKSWRKWIWLVWSVLHFWFKSWYKNFKSSLDNIGSRNWSHVCQEISWYIIKYFDLIGSVQAQLHWARRHNLQVNYDVTVLIISLWSFTSIAAFDTVFTVDKRSTNWITFFNYGFSKSQFFLDLLHACVLGFFRLCTQCALPLLLFLVEYLALADLVNLLAQLPVRIHHFIVYDPIPLALLTKLSIMHCV